MKKYPIVFFLLFLAAAQLNAQEFRTDESITKQLKNNSVPGLKYSTETSTAKPQVQPHATLIEEINKGKYAPVKSGPGTARSSAKPAQPNAADLPSNKSATDAAREAKAAQKAPVVQAPPTQDGGSGAPAETRTAPVRGGKLDPVKKDQQ
ncbi:MAG: hypothetical protein DI535_19810 [Citrobacter freundii]|nr:MAG: hypothetical protein DI535_19810 [Citrobacter freundii]